MSVLAVLDSYAQRDDQLWYVGHPVHPTEDDVASFREREEKFIAANDGWPRRASDHEVKVEIIRENIRNAKQWLAWLRNRFPTITFIAPWIVALDGGGDDDLDPVQRERGLRDCCRTIRRCDGMVHVGGRVSSGMAEEAHHAMRLVDLTFLGRPPPIADVHSAGRMSR